MANVANTVNYAELFDKQLKQRYSEKLLTSGLTTQNVSFSGAKTIRVPFVTVRGYKNHSRSGGFNRQSVGNDWMELTLGHDRDTEIFIDSMDADETNEALAANTTIAFEEEQAIPETDVYRLSKLFTECVRYRGPSGVDADILTSENVLAKFDEYMEEMDNAEVPMEGRILYVTPAVYTMIKQADEIGRFVSVTGANDGQIRRTVSMLDDVEIVRVPASRMKTAYDFTDGFKPAVSAAQMNMILVQPSSVIAVNKHAYIKLWEPGTHTVGDGYLYQNRQYLDLFLLKTRAQGVLINFSPATPA